MIQFKDPKLDMPRKVAQPHKYSDTIDQRESSAEKKSFIILQNVPV
jgi:hypothetical protein